MKQKWKILSHKYESLDALNIDLENNPDWEPLNVTVEESRGCDPTPWCIRIYKAFFKAPTDHE
jgi:hypothetical protein